MAIRSLYKISVLFTFMVLNSICPEPIRKNPEYPNLRATCFITLFLPLLLLMDHFKYLGCSVSLLSKVICCGMMM